MSPFLRVVVRAAVVVVAMHVAANLFDKATENL
jgi:hypothetical protein